MISEEWQTFNIIDDLTLIEIFLYIFFIFKYFEKQLDHILVPIACYEVVSIHQACYKLHIREVYYDKSLHLCVLLSCVSYKLASVNFHGSLVVNSNNNYHSWLRQPFFHNFHIHAIWNKSISIFFSLSSNYIQNKMVFSTSRYHI